MPRFLKILAVIALVIGVLAGIGAIIVARMEKGLESLRTTEIADVDLSAVPDGTYAGSFARLPVSVAVDVTVADHVIVDIVIREHVNGQGGDAEAIIDDIVAANSLDVDAVAGATYSSKAILLAVKDALETLTPAS